MTQTSRLFPANVVPLKKSARGSTFWSVLFYRDLHAQRFRFSLRPGRSGNFSRGDPLSKIALPRCSLSLRCRWRYGFAVVNMLLNGIMGGLPFMICL
jgi:hypothetical protein